jgi:hypothetical protein
MTTGLTSKSTVKYTLRESVHRDALCGESVTENKASGEVIVRTQRYDDNLAIRNNIKCDFDCMATVENNSPKCNGNGNFACGICICNEQYFGKLCEFMRPTCENPGQESVHNHNWVLGSEQEIYEQLSLDRDFMLKS